MDPHHLAPLGTRRPVRTQRTTTAVLTVTEAARMLRIGRSTAYDAANRYLDGDPDGLPVIRIGRSLRVPLTAIAELLGVPTTELTPEATTPDAPARTDRTPRTTRSQLQAPAPPAATSDTLTLPGM